MGWTRIALTACAMKRSNSIPNPPHPRGLRPPYLASFSGLTSARSIPPTSSKNAKALVFPRCSCIFRHRQFQTPDDQAILQNRGSQAPKPAAELSKPVDSNFDGLARLLEASV